MKRISILTLAILMTIISCQKEHISDNIPTKNGDYYTYKLDASNDLVNTEDSEAEKIDKQLLVLSDVFIETLKSNEIREYIYTSAKTNDGFLSLESFFTKFPSIENDINQKLSDNQYAKEFSIKNLADITNNMMHMGTQMYPVINIPNIESFQNNNNFISSAGIEIEDDETNNIMDEVFAWFIKDNEKIEISIGEKIALEKSIPLFVFTVHSDESFLQENIDEINLTSNENNSETSGKTNFYFKSTQHKINYRYEGSGNSDYCQVAKYFQPDIPSGYTIKETHSSGAKDYKYKQLNSIKKKYVGKTINKTISNLANSYNNNNHYFNNFERDWYGTRKHLGYVNKHSKNLWLKGRMTYPNEWYSFSNTNLYNYAVSGYGGYYGASYKGFIRYQ